MKCYLEESPSRSEQLAVLQNRSAGAVLPRLHRAFPRHEALQRSSQASRQRRMEKSLLAVLVMKASTSTRTVCDTLCLNVAPLCSAEHTRFTAQLAAEIVRNVFSV